MADPLEPAVPQRRERTEAKSFRELREEYREQNLQRIRAMTRPDDLQLRDAAGNVIKRIPTGLRTTAPVGQDFRKPSEFQGSVPDFEQMEDVLALANAHDAQVAQVFPEFETLAIPQSEADDLSRQAKDVLEQGRVIYPGNPTGDASREGPPLASLDEETLSTYLAENVQQACGSEALAPHLSTGGDDAALQESGQQQVCEGEGRSQATQTGSGAGRGAKGSSEEDSGPDIPGQAYRCSTPGAFPQSCYIGTGRGGHSGSGCAAPGTIASFPPGTFYFPATDGLHAYPGNARNATNSPYHVFAPGKWWRLLASSLRRCFYRVWYRGNAETQGRNQHYHRDSDRHEDL